MPELEIAHELWSQMTPFEQIQLYGQRIEFIQQGWSMIFTMLAMYLSIITGYLVAAFVAGAQLTRPQALIATVTYLFGSVMMVVGMISWAEVINQYHSTNAAYWEFIGATFYSAQANAAAETNVIDALGLVLLVVGVLAPLYFMWSVRHPKTE